MIKDSLGRPTKIVMTDGLQTIAGVKTFNDGLKLDDVADQSVFNYYKESTFTPVLEQSGRTGITYSSQQGKYIRIGNAVHFLVNIRLTNAGSGGSGGFYISGLPFVPNSFSDWHPVNLVIKFWTYSSQPVAYVYNGLDRITLMRLVSGGDVTPLDAPSNNSGIGIAGSYFI